MLSNGVDVRKVMNDSKSLGLRISSLFRTVPAWYRLGQDLQGLAYDLTMAVNEYDREQRARKADTG
jgi:hypothetical protein